MRQRIISGIVLVVLCAGCNPPSDRMEITEIRKTTAEQREAMPLLGTAVRMGLAEERETVSPPPHGDIPPPMLQAPDVPVVQGTPSFDPARLVWQAPEGWQSGGERPMRLATYVPANAANTECVVTLLSGTAGGISANLNRWRAQLGLEPLTNEEIAALPRWDMLGVQCTYIACTDAGGDAMLYGVICPVPGGLLFVKMMGPLHEMEAEADRFREFCLSMNIKGDG